MSIKLLRANLFLLIAAAIFGFAFVAQIEGMKHIGPMTFNAIRFLMGGLVILPIYKLTSKRASKTMRASHPFLKYRLRYQIIFSAGAGILLFMGATLQQFGLLTTSAGNAGFITGFYIVLIPLLGLFLGHSPGKTGWAGAAIAFGGLYFLSINHAFTMKHGDFLEFLGALFWAGHMLFIGHYVKNIPPFLLAGIQFMTVGIISFVGAIYLGEFRFDTAHFSQIPLAWASLLYAGLLSTAVAYTLQVVGQQYAHPAHAAIILGFEALFAALGGYLILNEVITARMILGASLMLAGMIISQINLFRIPKLA